MRYVAARFSPNHCWTGPSGTSCGVELRAGPAGAIVTLSTTIANGPYAGLVFYNPIHIDIDSNFWTPHHEHRTARNIDVRANGAEYSIPFDDEIRNWFSDTCLEIFGQRPLHESQGTINEHYHIRG